MRNKVFDKVCTELKLSPSTFSEKMCDGAQTEDGELLKIWLQEKDHMLILRTRRRRPHKTRRSLIEGKHVSTLSRFTELDVGERKREHSGEDSRKSKDGKTGRSDEGRRSCLFVRLNIYTWAI